MTQATQAAEERILESSQPGSLLPSGPGTLGKRLNLPWSQLELSGSGSLLPICPPDHSPLFFFFFKPALCLAWKASPCLARVWYHQQLQGRARADRTLTLWLSPCQGVLGSGCLWSPLPPSSSLVCAMASFSCWVLGVSLPPFPGPLGLAPPLSVVLSFDSLPHQHFGSAPGFQLGT